MMAPMIFNGKMAREVIATKPTLPRVRGSERYDKGHLALRLARGLASANDGECWEWTKNKIPKGYGLLGFGPHNLYTHRVAFELYYGVDPHGKWVCHKCDNPKCINPAHLFLGTPTDNIRDCIAKGRRVNHSTPQPGEINGRAKLKTSDVLAIRARYVPGYGSQATLAREYGVSSTLVFRIVNRIAWKHLPEPTQ